MFTFSNIQISYNTDYKNIPQIYKGSSLYFKLLPKSHLSFFSLFSLPYNRFPCVLQKNLTYHILHRLEEANSPCLLISAKASHYGPSIQYFSPLNIISFVTSKLIQASPRIKNRQMVQSIKDITDHLISTVRSLLTQNTPHIYYTCKPNE